MLKVAAAAGVGSLGGQGPSLPLPLGPVCTWPCGHGQGCSKRLARHRHPQGRCQGYKDEGWDTGWERAARGGGGRDSQDCNQGPQGGEMLDHPKPGEACMLATLSSALMRTDMGMGLHTHTGACAQVDPCTPTWLLLPTRSQCSESTALRLRGPPLRDMRVSPAGQLDSRGPGGWGWGWGSGRQAGLQSPQLRCFWSDHTVC